ncbi:MAG: hypothetical protein OXI73_01905 [Rhodospirillales bacterium]|nr:hypothetical protein [Rhodospirillales bacterium]
MTPVQAALLVLLTAATATLPSPGSAQDQNPQTEPSELRQILEICLQHEIPWQKCFHVAKQDGKVANPDLGRAEACVLAGGDAHYCFPHLKQRSEARSPIANSTWFFLQPRSLWTHTPYDLLSARGR